MSAAVSFIIVTTAPYPYTYTSGRSPKFSQKLFGLPSGSVTYLYSAWGPFEVSYISSANEAYFLSSEIFGTCDDMKSCGHESDRSDNAVPFMLVTTFSPSSSLPFHHSHLVVAPQNHGIFFGCDLFLLSRLLEHAVFDVIFRVISHL